MDDEYRQREARWKFEQRVFCVLGIAPFVVLLILALVLWWTSQ